MGGGNTAQHGQLQKRLTPPKEDLRSRSGTQLENSKNLVPRTLAPLNLQADVGHPAPTIISGLDTVQKLLSCKTTYVPPV